VSAIAVILILAALVAGAGGILPDFLPACAVAAVLGLLLVRLPAEARRFWWLGTLALAWVLVTVLPLPPWAVGFAGARRDAAFGRVDQLARAHAAVARLPAPAPDAVPGPSLPDADADIWGDIELPNGDGAAATLTPPTAGATVATVPLHPLAPAAGALPADSPMKAIERTATALRPSVPEPPPPVARRISLNVAGTCRFFLLAAGAWGMLWLVASQGLGARRNLLKALVAGGTLVVACGLLGRYAAPLTADALPLRIFAEYGHELSVWPFVNRNHFATFAAMLVPAALCLVLYPHLGVPRHLHAAAPREDERGQPRAPLPWSGGAGHTLAAQRLLFLVCFAVLVLGVFLSLSRGGILALLVGVMITVLYWLRGRQTGASTIATLLGIAVLLGLLFLPSEQVQERLQTLHRNSTRDRSEVIRFQYWHDSLGIWRHFPLCGSGFESFRTVFKRYQTVPGISGPRYAENEYVQLLADGGLIGTGLAGGLVALWFCAFTRGRRDAQAYAPPPAREDDADDLRLRPLRAAVLGGVAVALFHCLFDFPLRIPLNAFLFAALLGAGLPRPPPRTAAAAGTTPARPGARAAPLLAALALLAGACLVADRIGLPQGHPDRDLFVEHAAPADLIAGLGLAPTYWLGWYQMGRQAMSRAIGDGNADAAAAIDYAGAHLAPAHPLAGGWWRQVFARASRAWQERFGERAPAAATRPRSAAGAAPPDDRTHSATAAAASAPPPSPAQRQALLKLAVACFRQAAACTPRDYRTWWTLGMAELARGERRQARAAFDHAILLAPWLEPDADKVLQARTPAEFPPLPRFE
jgi:O-antigen ligase